MIPTDVETADDASLWTNSFELRDVINKLRNQSPEATHYVVFDACREELRLTLAGKKAFSPGEGFRAGAHRRRCNGRLCHRSQRRDARETSKRNERHLSSPPPFKPNSESVDR